MQNTSRAETNNTNQELVLTQKLLFAVAAIAAILAVSPALSAKEIKIVTYNTESDDDTAWANVAADIGSISGVDIWGLQEVEGQQALDAYLATVEAGAGQWEAIISRSGASSSPTYRSDQLAIMYRTDMFKLLDVGEYMAIKSTPGTGKYGRTSRGLRGLLYVKLLERDTQKEFYVGNVHLKCCGGDGLTTREHQAKLMKDWIDRADAPVFLLGDFNIPIAPNEQNGPTGSAAYDIIAGDLSFAYPSNAMKTQCNPRYNSMLDAHFYSPEATAWSPEAEVLKTSQAYCDAEGTDQAPGGADHRPVMLTVDVN